jgi:hypothetical protein
MDTAIVVAILLGIVVGLILAFPLRRPFRLWQLLALIALVGCLFALGRAAIHAARYAAAQSAYGGRRFTRGQAESLRGDKSPDILPDSEFLESAP